MNKNIILCGVGGQGIVLAARLIAAMAMDAGLDVMSAETIGMAQRGGSVFSFVRIGEGVATPMMGLGSADLIIGFEPAEAVRMLPYLKKDGTVVVNTAPVIPVTASLRPDSYSPDRMIPYLQENVSRLKVCDAAACAASLGSGKVLNMVLLGAAAACGALGFDTDTAARIMEDNVPPRFRELNRAAFRAGTEL